MTLIWLPSIDCLSTPLQLSVELRHVGLVIDNDTLYFYPGVSFGCEDPRSDHEFGGESKSAQKHRQGNGTLEAQNSLEVKDTCDIHGMTYLLSGITSWLVVRMPKHLQGILERTFAVPSQMPFRSKKTGKG
jgi:hypothetical protein